MLLNVQSLFSVFLWNTFPNYAYVIKIGITIDLLHPFLLECYAIKNNDM